MRLISLDLWILLKSRLLLKFLIKILSPLIQVVALMALGAGIVLYNEHLNIVNPYVESVSDGKIDRVKIGGNLFEKCITLEPQSNYLRFLTGILTAYTLVYVRINIPIYTKEHTYIGAEPSDEPVLRIDTSSAESSILQRELANLKNQALEIEMNLRKMRNQYKDLSKVARSNYRDEKLADFASEAAGGSVLDTPDTESYHQSNHQQATLFGIPIWKTNYFTPRKVIQPWTQAGECWAFKGSIGKIVIKLARVTIIDKVTLEHIPVSASLTGLINSAPQYVVIYGFIGETFIPLDSFTYDINGPSSQTFSLMNERVKLYPIEKVLLEIKSNWGHPDYTCVYRFKIHGKMANPEITENINTGDQKLL